MSDTIIKTTPYLDPSEIGRKFLFWNPALPEGLELGFSSRLEHIGDVPNHDCRLKNKTEVVALSEPTDAYHPVLGFILVTKIMAHAIMWVPTFTLVEVDE